MKNLNLVNLDKSDVKYTIQNFPDGQKNIVIPVNQTHRLDDMVILDITSEPIRIISRLNNMEDMGLIICAVACLRRLGIKEIHLNVPYLLGARSDRKFAEGGNSYLVDVIAPLINAQNFESVTVLDVHNPDVTAACVKNLVVESNIPLVTWSLANIQADKGNGQSTNLFNDVVLLSPDAGASKKIQKVADAIGYKGDIITCSKERDNDGNLTRVNVPLALGAGHGKKDLIIIDDICDGGATFINITKRIKEYKYDNKIYLIVTHGIFSKGYSELAKYFDGIYCTNSYANTLKGSFYNYDTTDLVKQLNIF